MEVASMKANPDKLRCPLSISSFNGYYECIGNECVAYVEERTPWTHERPEGNLQPANRRWKCGAIPDGPWRELEDL